MTTQVTTAHEIDAPALIEEAHREAVMLECFREDAYTEARRAGRTREAMSQVIDHARRSGRAEEASVHADARLDRLTATTTDAVRDALDAAVRAATVAIVAAQHHGDDEAASHARAALDELDRAAHALDPHAGQ